MTTAAPASLLPTVDAVAAKIKDAMYHARDHGGTMHTGAEDAARDVLDLLWRTLADTLPHDDLPADPGGTFRVATDADCPACYWPELFTVYAPAAGEVAARGCRRCGWRTDCTCDRCAPINAEDDR